MSRVLYARLKAAPDIEYRYDYDLTIPLSGGPRRNCVRIFYRNATHASRRLTRFLLVGDVDESLESLEAKIEPALALHAGVSCIGFVCSRCGSWSPQGTASCLRCPGSMVTHAA